MTQGDELPARGRARDHVAGLGAAGGAGAHGGPADPGLTPRDLRPLFDPVSVAVVGASDDETKWGHGVAVRALCGEHRRSVFLVNRSRTEVLGRRAFASLHDLPEGPELVVVAVDASVFETVVDDALAVGARAIVVLTAGMGETGPEGAERERSVGERVRRAGAVLVGPNCMGVFDAVAEMGTVGLTSGPIGIIAQSGNFALELEQLAAAHGLGFSRFASLGNQADLQVPEALSSFVQHGPTEIIAVYCEDFGDGRAFAAAALEAAQAGKPILLLDAGRSSPGAAAARSHTGALLSQSRAVEAACRATGILRVGSPRELVDLAAGLIAGVRPRGRRLGVLTDGGYNGVIACDLATEHGLDVLPFSEDLSSALTDTLSPLAPTRNPVDVADVGPRDYLTYGRAAELLVASRELDAVLLTGYFGGYCREGGEGRERELQAAVAVAKARARGEAPIVAHSMFPQGETACELRRLGVPVYPDTEAAVAVLARLAGRFEQKPSGVPSVPDAVEPVTSSGYFEARRLLGGAGIPFPEAMSVGGVEEAVAAAERLGYPVVLKALGNLHKSAGGGVVLGLDTPDALAAAVERLQVSHGTSNLSVEQFVVAAGSVELVIGCRRDARFGPVALVGLGGVHTEVFDDVVAALAPVDAGVALGLFSELRAAPLLAGLDLQLAAHALAALSDVAARHPEIAEVEINPLLISPAGAVALDARLVIQP